MPTIAIFFGIIVRMWHDDHPHRIFMWSTKGLRLWSRLKPAWSRKASFHEK